MDLRLGTKPCQCFWVNSTEFQAIDILFVSAQPLIDLYIVKNSPDLSAMCFDRHHCDRWNTMLRFVRYNFFRETRRVPILTGLYKIQFPHHMKRLLAMWALWLGWEAHLVNPSQVIKSYVTLSIHTEQVLASLPKVWEGREGRENDNPHWIVAYLFTRQYINFFPIPE